MPPSSHPLLTSFAPALLLAASAAVAVPATAAAPDPAAGSAQVAQEPDLSTHVAQLKEMQVRLMWRGAQRRFERSRAAQRINGGRPAAWRPAGGRGAPGASAPAGADARARGPVAGVGRRPAPTGEPPDPPGLAPPGVATVESPAGATAIATNRIANNRATDNALCGGLPCSGQCEVSIAAHGNNLVAAWNDGEGFDDGTSTQGFAYSTDNGTTWIDGGIPPVSGGVTEWTSDPVIAVNEKTGAFYYSALCSPTSTTNGIAVVKGTFSGGVFAWGTPKVVISGSNASVVYDKEWLAADSLTGNLYLVYAKFTPGSDQIEFTRNTSDNLLGWSSPIKLSAAADDGRVQGARVAVGPSGELYAVWNAIGVFPPFVEDFMRVRKSTTQGSTWGSEATAVSQYTNFGTGAPGFNRGLGFAFPSIAVDRGTGPRRGRVYLAWNESVNFYDDSFGSTGSANSVIESEANDSPATADAFTMGRTLRGSMGSPTDFDYWSFSGTQGQTIICELDSIAAALNASFRVFCTDGSTRLAFSETGVGSTGLVVFTLPATGTYYLRVAPFAGTGGYRIRTVLNGAVTERGRDQRDVFVNYSDNGTTWSTPVRVNGEAALYDDWLPEVAVAPNGNVYLLWYDWRDAPASLCAGASMTYLSRSTDGGATWPDGSPVSSALSNWTTALSNILPNQGDYTSLFTNQNAVYAAWSDGRNSDPDIFMAAVDLAFTAVQISLAGTHAEPGLVRITWHTAADASLAAAVDRRTDEGDWTRLATVSPDGAGMIVFEDREVVPGGRYHYRLGLREGDGETFAGEVTVEVPRELTLAIDGVRPNPAEREIWVSFSLPDGEPAVLELLDVAGRRVRAEAVAGAGRKLLDLARGERLPAGVYLARLTQAGKSAVARVSVVR